jgi:hypothetical protein
MFFVAFISLSVRFFIILSKSRSVLTALQRKVKRVASLDKQIVACDEQRKILEEQIKSATEV